MLRYPVHEHESVGLDRPYQPHVVGDAVRRVKRVVRLAITPVRRWRTLRDRHRRAADEHELVRRVGLTVQSGPFRGLKLVPATAGLGPKLLGSFEREIWPAVERIAACGARHVISLGSAEGYYPIGLLRMMPGARGIAFEADTAYHQSLAQMASLNQVELDRLEIRGTCDVAGLRSAAERADHEPTVAVIDVEGHEVELLDPLSIPALRRMFILVEIHDFVDPRISTLLRDRFRNTHSLEVYRTRARQIHDLPPVRGLRPQVLMRLAQERRPTRMEWFWFEPLGG